MPIQSVDRPTLWNSNAIRKIRDIRFQISTFKFQLMIILTAGHTGPHTGAQSITTQFDEGSETIWLRNRVAEILTNKYGLVVLMDNDTASLKLLLSELNQTGRQEDTKNHVLMSSCRNQTSKASSTVDNILIDIHFNAHSNPQARGTETIISDHATTLELRFASHLAHTTAHALGIPLRGIKSESQTPHHRLAILHITPQSIILEVCFCTSPEDVEAYRNNREKLAADLAWAIAELILDRMT